MPKQPKTALITVSALARRLNCHFEGKAETGLLGISSPEKAQEGDLVFIADRRHLPLLEKTKASAAIIPKEETYKKIPVILAENPFLTFIKAVDIFYTPYRPKPGIHPQALVSPSAKIGKDVAIGPLVYVDEEVEIGPETVIFPFVSLYPRVKIGQKTVIHSHVSIREETRIGNRVIIHNGVVIGSDGFGYLEGKDGTRIKIPQKGIVVIEDDVEVGANTTIDRATLGETVIKRGTKIDNLVQVAHNVEIGENSVLAAQTGIAGSSKIGKHVIMGGQVGISDHVTIGDNARIAAKSGIPKDIPADAFVGGIPPFDMREARKIWVSLPHLFNLVKDMKKLKKRIEELEKKK